MFVVVVEEEPITIESVIADPLFKLAVVDPKAPETLLCSLAIWLTVIEFDPVLALLVVVAENASFWLLLTPKVLKSDASFKRSAAVDKTFITDTALPNPLIVASELAMLFSILAFCGALYAFTSASTIFLVSKEAPAPSALI
jgi:hypothetical protein